MVACVVLVRNRALSGTVAGRRATEPCGNEPVYRVEQKAAHPRTYDYADRRLAELERE